SASIQAQQLGDLVLEQRELLASLAEVREQREILALDLAAVEQPRARAQQLVELDDLAIADEHPVLAGGGPEQAMELAQQLLGEVAIAVAEHRTVGLDLAPGHLHGQVAVGLEQVEQARVALLPRLEVEVALGLGVEAGVDQREEVAVLNRVRDDLEAEAI